MRSLPDAPQLRTILIDSLYSTTQARLLRSVTAAPAHRDPISAQQRRGFWLRQLHQWHWISSAVCLVAMLLFTATGITLNHAAKIEAAPRVDNRTGELPAPLLVLLGKSPEEGNAPLPPAVAAWLGDELDIALGRRPAEWSEDEAYVSMPSPGVDAWLSIDRATGAIEYERTSRGWVSYFNDLHKGLYCISGLFLLHLHARQRRLTWPLVGLGLVVPLLLALLFIH